MPCLAKFSRFFWSFHSKGMISRTLEREEQQFEAKLAALRTAIDEGDASGVAEGNSFERVRRPLKLSKKKR
jgi:hypothetical protein